MTANALKGDRELCIDVGMNDYVTKPIDPSIFLKTLEKYLSKIIPGHPKSHFEISKDETTFDKQAFLNYFDGDIEFCQEIINSVISDTKKECIFYIKQFKKKI